MTEADTCRKFVGPLLQQAGWNTAPHSIAEQRPFTDGRIAAFGPTALRCPGKRADRVEQQQAAFCGNFAPEVREILNDLLGKYAADGELQFTLPDVLKLPPISQHGKVNENVGKFGGADQLRNAVTQLQTLLYAA